MIVSFRTVRERRVREDREQGLQEDFAARADEGLRTVLGRPRRDLERQTDGEERRRDDLLKCFYNLHNLEL